MFIDLVSRVSTDLPKLPAFVERSRRTNKSSRARCRYVDLSRTAAFGLLEQKTRSMPELHASALNQMSRRRPLFRSRRGYKCVRFLRAAAQPNLKWFLRWHKS